MSDQDGKAIAEDEVSHNVNDEDDNLCDVDYEAMSDRGTEATGNVSVSEELNNSSKSTCRNSVSKTPVAPTASSRSTRSRDNPEFVAKQKSFIAKIQAASSGIVEGMPNRPETPGGGKRKRETNANNSVGTGGSGGGSAKRRKSTRTDDNGMDFQNDNYCWECHREGVFICCEMCPRVFHLKCLGMEKEPEDDWACSECHAVMQAENVENRSRAMQMISVEQLCTLLKFAVNRLKSMPGMEPFCKPVDTSEFPTYQEMVVHPVDFTSLERNIKKKFYGSTEAFLSDARWIVHNSVIFNGANSKVTSVARTLLKILKQEMSEIETCPDCYMNAHLKPDSWFTEACRSAHPLIWARLKGFPFWPAKAVKVKDGSVDARFFGRHDRSWVPVKECFLFSEQMPTPLKNRNKTLESCLVEVNEHISKLKQKYGKFRHAPHRVSYNPNDLEQIKMLLPSYKGPPLPRVRGSQTRTFSRQSGHSDDETSSIASTDSYSSSRRQRKSRPSSSVGMETETDAPSEVGSIADESASTKETVEREEEEEEEEADKTKEEVKQEDGVTVKEEYRGVEQEEEEEEEEEEEGEEGKAYEEQQNGVKEEEEEEEDQNDSSEEKKVDNEEVDSEGNDEEMKEKINDDSDVKGETEDAKEVNNEVDDKDSEPGDEGGELVSTVLDRRTQMEVEDMGELDEYRATVELRNCEENGCDSDDDVEKEKHDVNESDAENGVEEGKDEVDENYDSEEEEEEEEEEENEKNSELSRDIDGEPNDENDCESEPNSLEGDESNRVNHEPEERNVLDEGEKCVDDAFQSDFVGEGNEEEEEDEEEDEDMDESESINLRIDETGEDDDDKDEQQNEEEEELKEGQPEDDDDQEEKEDEEKEEEEEEEEEEDDDRGGGKEEEKEEEDEKEEEEEEEMDEEEEQKEEEMATKGKEETSVEEKMEIEEVGKEVNTEMDVSEDEEDDSSSKENIDEKMERIGSVIVRRYSANKESAKLKSEKSVKYSSEEKDDKIEAKVEKEEKDKGSTESENISEGEKKNSLMEAVKLVQNMGTIEIKRLDVKSVESKNSSGNVTISVAKDLEEVKDKEGSGNRSEEEGVKADADSSTDNTAKESSSTPSISSSVSVTKAVDKDKEKEKEKEKDTEKDKVKMPSGVDTTRLSPSISIIPVASGADRQKSKSTVAPSTSSVAATSTTASSSATNKSGSGSSPAVPPLIPASEAIPPPPPLSQPMGPSTSGAPPLTSRGVFGPPPPGGQLMGMAGVRGPMMGGPGPHVRMMGGPGPGGMIMGGGRLPGATGPGAGPPTRHLPPDAGPLSTELHKYSHKLAELMRATLEDIIRDLANCGSPEAQVKAIQLELERANWRHQQEIAEVKHNADVMLMEIRANLEAEKQRAVEEVRRQMEQQMAEQRRQMERQMEKQLIELKRQMEVEKQRAVEETKKKQWCANCGKEALFFCCWNTSYCDYPCQQAHWPQHMSVCGQNSDGGGGGAEGGGAESSINGEASASASAASSRVSTPVHNMGFSQGDEGSVSSSILAQCLIQEVKKKKKTSKKRKRLERDLDVLTAKRSSQSSSPESCGTPSKMQTWIEWYLAQSDTIRKALHSEVDQSPSETKKKAKPEPEMGKENVETPITPKKIKGINSEKKISVEKGGKSVKGIRKKRKSTPCLRKKFDHILSPDEITSDMLDRIAQKPKDKTYDQNNGTSCHQCRQKTADTKTICRSGKCVGLRGFFCGPCLRTRYGEDAGKALLDAEWSCPVCRGICNCSLCRKASAKQALVQKQNKPGEKNDNPHSSADKLGHRKVCGKDDEGMALSERTSVLLSPRAGD